MSAIVIYPGTFDPITLGHLDIVQRASVLFDQVVVAVAPTHRKSCYFTLAERLSLAKQALVDFPKVRVAPMEGLLVDFVRNEGAKVILRGLRVMSDFDYELQLSHMNYKLSPDIETVFLLAKPEDGYISSSIVREIIDLKKDITPFVPKIVAEYLKQKLESGKA